MRLSISSLALLVVVAACGNEEPTRPAQVTVADIIRVAGDARITTSATTFTGYLDQVLVDADNPLMVSVRSAATPPMARSAVLADPGSAYYIMLLPASSPETGSRGTLSAAPAWTTADRDAVQSAAVARGGRVIAPLGRTLMIVPPANAQQRSALLTALSAHANVDYVSLQSPSTGGGCRSPGRCN